MSEPLRIALAQLDLTVGAVPRNAARIREALAEARAQGAQLVVTPELALTGYPPEDLLEHGGLLRQVEAALAALAREAQGIALIVGHPRRDGARLHNCASLLAEGRVVATYRKQLLPNYRVFDEKRWFAAGDAPCVVEVAGARLGITICEDLWWPGPAAATAAAGAELIVNLSASPYEMGKPLRREGVFAARVAEARVPLLTVNLCGGQDELLFDGSSFVLDAAGRCAARLPECAEAVVTVGFERGADRRLAPVAAGPHLAPHLALEPSVYGALRLGVRDYALKNGFAGAVLGLSGGIDSALTLALAADALGGDAVTALMMPSRHTAELSLRGAAAQAAALGVEYHCVTIEPAFEALLGSLAPLLGPLEGPSAVPGDLTAQNLQARCRGVMLMAASNRTGRLLLSTGNKSEVAVGYATLYGDMAGGYAPLRDVYKTLVWRLARWRNRDGEVIPREVIERPPTAELAPGQTDQDQLPPYEVLDAILEAFVEDDLAVDEVVTRGHDRATVERVVRMVQRAEFKRRQAAPGPMVSRRAFGRDRRYPITSGYDPAAR
jgi:NAD+ synthase (glutamine-hydrolysing)